MSKYTVGRPKSFGRIGVTYGKGLHPCLQSCIDPLYGIFDHQDIGRRTAKPALLQPVETDDVAFRIRLSPEGVFRAHDKTEQAVQSGDGERPENFLPQRSRYNSQRQLLRKVPDQGYRSLIKRKAFFEPVTVEEGLFPDQASQKLFSGVLSPIVRPGSRKSPPVIHSQKLLPVQGLIEPDSMSPQYLLKKFQVDPFVVDDDPVEIEQNCPD